MARKKIEEDKVFVEEDIDQKCHPDSIFFLALLSKSFFLVSHVVRLDRVFYCVYCIGYPRLVIDSQTSPYGKSTHIPQRTYLIDQSLFSLVIISISKGRRAE